jgi:hypothetical protein
VSVHSVHDDNNVLIIPLCEDSLSVLLSYIHRLGSLLRLPASKSSPQYMFGLSVLLRVGLYSHGKPRTHVLSIVVVSVFSYTHAHDLNATNIFADDIGRDITSPLPVHWCKERLKLWGECRAAILMHHILCNDNEYRHMHRPHHS